jgi:predicted MFS family arabinose efflux permease
VNAENSKDKLKLFLACFVPVYGIGYLSYMLSPIVIGSVVDGMGLDEGEAGFVAAAELISLALSVIFLAPRMGSIRRRRLAFVGVAVVFVGHGLAALASEFWLLVATRAIAGVGLGLLIAAGNAAIAGSGTPQRLFAAVLTLGQLQAAALLLFVMPEIAVRWSYHGTYGFLACWALVLSPLIWFLPNQPPEDIGVAQSPTGGLALFVLPTVLAMVLIGASDSSVWTFTERIANSLGMDTQEAGMVLAAALVAGVIGSAISGIVGTRFGEVGPIGIGSMALAVGYFAVVTASNPTVYAAAQITVIGLFGFLIPDLYGVNGRLDLKGRIMVAASGAHLAGMGLGPGFAGQAILIAGYGGVGTMISGSVIVAAALFLLSIKRKANSGVPGPVENTNG